MFDIFNFRVKQDWSYLRRMFKVGWPISLQMSGGVLSLLVVSMMVGWLGVNALAAYQVTSQFMFIVVIPIFALSQAGGILIGQALGGKQFWEIKILGKSAIQLGFVISGIAALIFLLFPRWLAAVYMDVHSPQNALTLHYVVWLFTIVAFSLLFDSCRNIVTGLLRGLFDTRYPMFVGLIVLWGIGIPASYLLAFVFKAGVVGIALGGLLGFLTGVMLMVLRWKKMTHKYAIQT